MKKLSLILVLFLLVACAGPLDKSFSEEQLDQRIQNVLESLENKDSQTLREQSTGTLAQALDDDTMEAVYEILNQAGGFVEIEKTTRASMTDKDSGELLAVCSVRVAYDNKTILYTMSFDVDYKLAGIFLK